MELFIQTKKYTASQLQSLVDAAFCSVLAENRLDEYRAIIRNIHQAKIVKERLCDVSGIGICHLKRMKKNMNEQRENHQIVYRKGFGEIPTHEEFDASATDLSAHIERLRVTQECFAFLAAQLATFEQFQPGKCARCGYDIDYAFRDGAWLFQVQDERPVLQCPGCHIVLTSCEIVPQVEE